MLQVVAWYLPAQLGLWLRVEREADSDPYKPQEEDPLIITPRCKMLT
jgi:hypothetical protein